MKHRWLPLAAAVFAVAATLVSAGTATANYERPPACAEPNSPEPPQQTPATLTTVGQAYYCIFDNYFSGPVLDSRDLLVPAFAALTQELQRRGLDQPDATLPALTGRKDPDWRAFSKVYQRIANALPNDEARGAIAAAAIQAMVDELDDNHARWQNKSSQNLVGLTLSAIVGPGDIDPVATQPVYVDRIAVDGPAAVAGVALGDELLAINGVPLFINGVFTKGALSWLMDAPLGSVVELTMRRPTTGETFTASVTAARFQAPRPAVESRLVDGNIAYVTLPGFTPATADQVLAAVAALRAQTGLRGVILDLRGNGGGSPAAVAKLLGALAHGKTTSYWCDVRDRCTPNRTDDSVELWNLPFVALTDRRCASACDSFTSSVKDLKLGKLVGTRTAGAVSGPGAPYLLDNGTVLVLPKHHEIGANKEVVNTVGVAPDHHAPMTAADLAAGRDPGLDKAVSLF
ncbi:S41 family peptidase [Actinophytocola sp.]|uniref:S41 family peptidase n=1 Tax=Actinophytocola sp. TaxID=1872138 RepID=UPI002ED44D09